ncbi:MAG: DUF1636 family protein [Acetobacteraceae bacterium]
MNGRIFVCTTCDRYAAAPPGDPTPGQLLAQAMKRRAAEIASPIVIRTVECLNACPKPCTAALRAPGKMIMRFSRLTPEDAPALLDAARGYAESADGNLPEEALAPRLSGKLAGRVRLTRL